MRIGEAMERRGWAVDIVSLTAERRHPTIEALPLTTRSPDQLDRMNLDVAASLLRALRDSDYDLILANGSATLRYVATVGRLAVRRRRLGYMAIGDPSYWARTRLARFRMRVLLRSVGWILAVSEASAGQIKAIAGADVDVDVVMSGVPSSFLEIDRGPRGGPLHVVVIGSLTREKDPEAAVEVLATSEAHVRLRFVGTGPLEDRVRALAEKLGVSDRVEIVGARSDIASDLSWAHVLLLTSRTEGLPGVVLEAGAACLPTLAFDVGGTREIVHDRSTGRLLPPGDIEGLAKALAELAEFENLRGQWGENAKAMVQTSFLMEHAADRYDQALRRRLT